MKHRARRPAWMLTWVTAMAAGLIWTLVTAAAGTGVPGRAPSEAAQASALDQLVHAAAAYARVDNVTDYRWFNLRDSVMSRPPTSVSSTFATVGLLRPDYTRKPAFAVYRRLIATMGR